METSERKKGFSWWSHPPRQHTDQTEISKEFLPWFNFCAIFTNKTDSTLPLNYVSITKKITKITGISIIKNDNIDEI